MKHFLTFGSEHYKGRVSPLCEQVKKLQIFNYIWGITDDHLKKDSQFWEQHKEHIEKNSRGYGYWVWKPYLIWVIMHCNMKDDDILLYLDAGCEINPQGKNRLLEYFDMVSEDPVGILAQIIIGTSQERRWTKSDIFDYLNTWEYKEEFQRASGIILFRKTPASINFVRDWYIACCNYELVSDKPSKIPNDPTFVENRHDQSMFSGLCHIYKVKSIPDETYYEDWDSEKSKSSPIHARRRIS